MDRFGRGADQPEGLGGFDLAVESQAGEDQHADRRTGRGLLGDR